MSYTHIVVACPDMHTHTATHTNQVAACPDTHTKWLHVLIHTHKHTQTKWLCVLIHTQTHMHTQTHAHIYTRTHTRTCTHTQTKTGPCWCGTTSVLALCSKACQYGSEMRHWQAYRCVCVHLYVCVIMCAHVRLWVCWVSMSFKDKALAFQVHMCMCVRVCQSICVLFYRCMPMYATGYICLCLGVHLSLCGCCVRVCALVTQTCACHTVVETTHAHTYNAYTHN